MAAILGDGHTASQALPGTATYDLPWQFTPPPKAPTPLPHVNDTCLAVLRSPGLPFGESQ